MARDNEHLTVEEMATKSLIMICTLYSVQLFSTGIHVVFLIFKTQQDFRTYPTNLTMTMARQGMFSNALWIMTMAFLFVWHFCLYVIYE